MKPCPSGRPWQRSARAADELHRNRFAVGSEKAEPAFTPDGSEALGLAFIFFP